MSRLISKTILNRRLLSVLLLSAISSASAAVKTWNGAGSDNNFETGGNWGGSTPTSSDSIVFGGSTRLSPNISGGSFSTTGVTFSSAAGAFTLGGNTLYIGSGGITNSSANTQTINNQIQLNAGQTWTASSGAIVTSGYINANSNNLSLAGSGALTIGGQISNGATIAISGSGNRTIGGQVNATTISNSGSGLTTFNSQVNASTVNLSGSGSNTFNNSIQSTGGTLNISNTGTNTFVGQVNTGTVNMSAGTSNFANVQASNSINLTGTAAANFTGPVSGGSSGINIASSGAVNFSGSISSGSLTLNGSGTTTISGSGAMSTGAVVVNSGTLVMNHTGSAAINSSLTVNAGGTVIFGANNQVPAWQTVTLNEGSTLLLGNTSQTIANLIITGDTVIDFGTGGSSLNVQSYGSISVANDVTITIVNWNGSTDVFSGSYPGTNVVNIEYADSTGNVYATGTWSSGSGGGYITPGTPVPEPSTYGLMMLGAGVGFVFWRRHRQSRSRA